MNHFFHRLDDVGVRSRGFALKGFVRPIHRCNPKTLSPHAPKDAGPRENSHNRHRDHQRPESEAGKPHGAGLSAGGSGFYLNWRYAASDAWPAFRASSTLLNSKNCVTSSNGVHVPTPTQGLLSVAMPSRFPTKKARPSRR